MKVILVRIRKCRKLRINFFYENNFVPEGMMFYTDVGKKAKIESAYMDGSNRKILVTENLISPNGLAIDFEENTLYWVDSGTHTLERITFSGDERKVVTGKTLGNLIISNVYYQITFFTAYCNA